MSSDTGGVRFKAKRKCLMNMRKLVNIIIKASEC